MSGLVERILRHGWNSGIWKGAYSDMASIRERNSSFVSLTVCRVIKESVKAKVKGDNNYEQ